MCSKHFRIALWTINYSIQYETSLSLSSYLHSILVFHFLIANEEVRQKHFLPPDFPPSKKLRVMNIYKAFKGFKN